MSKYDSGFPYFPLKEKQHVLVKCIKTKYINYISLKIFLKASKNNILKLVSSNLKNIRKNYLNHKENSRSLLLLI